jgi:hypothetical protein
MHQKHNTRTATCTRRSFLAKAAVAAGGIALAGAVLAPRPAAAKAAQKLVGYQDTPHGAQQCDNCAQFVAPSSCKVVDGTISPSGWCKVYVKRPAT